MIIHKDFNLTTQFFYSSSPKIVSLKVIEVDEDMNLFLGEKKLLFEQDVASSVLSDQDVSSRDLEILTFDELS